MDKYRLSYLKIYFVRPTTLPSALMYICLSSCTPPWLSRVCVSCDLFRYLFVLVDWDDSKRRKADELAHSASNVNIFYNVAFL